MGSIGNEDTEERAKGKTEKDTVAQVHEPYYHDNMVNGWIIDTIM